MRLPLYLRIWGAVVLAVVVITAAFATLVHLSADPPRPREVLIRSSQTGEVLGQARTRPVVVPGQGVEFTVSMNDGSSLVVQMPPRPRGPGERPGPQPWLRGTTGLVWMLVIVAIAVAIGIYPVIRRLTQRLESLTAGVERLGEGDLHARVDEAGSDEIAILARRFNHAAARIEQLIASHKTLLANASHELRSPLARIRMGMALLEADANAPVRAEIERNIAELDELVGEILLASRLDARSADVGTVEPVDLTGLAAEECAQAGAELLDSQQGQAVMVDGVSRLLRRVVRNLLENARRYSDGPVTVDVRREGAWAVLRVSDRGPGVAPAHRERHFEPLNPQPGASERAGGGGRGLSRVKSIVQRHGGSVSCEGRDDGPGARFTVKLPATAACA